MAKDPRNISYKKLRSKILNNKKREYAFDDTLSRVMQTLWPKQKVADPKDNNKVAREMQDTFDKRLAMMEKNNAKQINNVRREGENTAAGIKESADKERKRSMGINKSLGEAVRKLYEERQKGPQQSSGQTSQPTTPEKPAEEQSSLGYTDPTVPTLGTTDYTVPENIITEETPVDDAIEKVVLTLKQEISFGDNYYRVTNLFGPRTGENRVANKGPEHSRGVDVVAHNSAREKTNAPISVTDGIIRSVSLEGSTTNVGSGSSEGGYVMNVEMPNGKMIRYMHLSPDVEAKRESLIGKSVKRGDILFEGDHNKWSGSGTANHTKISISNVDGKGNLLKDHDNPENDPSPYILYGKANN